MAMRRPRIKAVANIQLNTKRKSKPSLDPVPAKSGRIQEIQESKISEKPTTTTSTTTSKEDEATKTSNYNECIEAPDENVVTEENSKETPNSEEHIEVTVANSRLNIQKTASSSKTVTNTKADDGSDEPLKTKVENVAAVEDSIKTKGDLGQNSNFEQLNIFTNTPNAEEDLNVSKTEARGVGNFYEIVSKEGGVNNTSLCLQSPKNNEIHQSLVLDKNTFHADSTKTVFPTDNNESDFTKGSLLTDDRDAFKCPAKVEYSRSVSHSSAGGADDVFYSDLEENVLQMDLQRSANGFPMSPSKIQSRQRIRPTPIFGQRRNSFVGSSPSSHNSVQEEPLTCTDFQRKERYHSASVNNTANSSTNQQNLHYTSYNKSASGRVRTESSCSNFSEINFPTHKIRRNDDRDVHRQHLRREFEARFINGVPDKSALKMFDLIYYNPITNPMEQKANENVKVEANSNDIKPFEAKQEKATVDDKLDTSASMPVPQLKLNANGELILDDESLVVETTAERKARKVWENSELIYLDENTGMNGFYKRQKRTREWEWSETIKFYRCLQTVGTDFSLMVSLFPNRTRRDLKLKFKKEERINGALINKALLHPKQFNIEELRQQVEAEEEERKKLQNMSKAYIEKKIKEPKKKKCAQQSAANRLLSGYDVYENENQKIKRRKNGKIKFIDGDKEKVIEDSGKEQDDTSTALNEECKRKSAKIGAEKRKRRRPTPINNDISNVKTQQIIKNEETSKYEDKQESLNLGSSAQEEDVKQLETELNNLLQTESYELTSATNAVTSLESVEPVKASLISSVEDFQTTGPTSVSDCHEFTLTNMDDGTITHVADLKNDGDERISLSVEIQEPDNDLVQQNIQKILTELAEGTLVLVSTLDPDNPDKVLNEIYMMDKDTGDLCDEPLNIPDDIVQCIMSVMS